MQLSVRGDNVGALTLVMEMRPETAKLAIIARELALCFVRFSFLPAVYHTPGISHVIADGLSRIHDPSKTGAESILSHPALLGSKNTAVPDRTPSFYRTLLPATSSQA